MLKELGAGLLFASCTGLGFGVARNYRNRPRHLRALQHGLRVLQSEIEYSVTPLPRALERTAKRSEAPINVLFRTASERLSEHDIPVATAIAQALEKCEGMTALNAKDLDVIREFGTTLGRSDRVHQSQNLTVALARLSDMERDAVESQRKNERLWQYLGVLAGLLFVILLY